MVFKNIENTKNKNTHASPNKFFMFFVFKKKKTIIENRNQTGPKIFVSSMQLNSYPLFSSSNWMKVQLPIQVFKFYTLLIQL